VGKTGVFCVTFLRDVAHQKLLNLANVSRSYSQNNTGTVFLRHGVVVEIFLGKEAFHCAVCSLTFEIVTALQQTVNGQLRRTISVKIPGNVVNGDKQRFTRRQQQKS